MALSKLDSLYRAVILDHSSHPHHHGSLAGKTPLILNNPTCGDVIQLTVELKDGEVKDIAFSGSGCSISTASASMMTDLVIGQTVQRVYELAENFSRLVQGQQVEDLKSLGEAAFLSGVAKFPSRIKCATLSWNALKKAIEADGFAQEILSCHEE
ncbi:MAG: SUF system NifU family Fe-S cluster assembly protein [Streptococcaceae bacterium]|jgi:nitrogen fixation NifU-like protein|nr:SUF system NifU family Fe-S cluster assembly protein [Streptococcaceae bacterium]